MPRTLEPPYRALEEARMRWLELEPTADDVKALWTPAGSSEIVVEIWHGRSAKVVAA